jgi:hypothetical protein
MSARAPRLTTSTGDAEPFEQRSDHHSGRDHADRTGHGGRLRHDLVRADRNHVPAAGRAVREARHHRLGFGQALHRVQHAVGRQRASRRGSRYAALHRGLPRSSRARSSASHTASSARHGHRTSRFGDDRSVNLDHADPRLRQAPPGNAPAAQVAPSRDQRSAPSFRRGSSCSPS